MRFKPVPEPPEDLTAVIAARDAVPLVPGPEDDCCAQLMDRRGFGSRDVARTWLTFLRALGLVVETDAGFRRVREDPTVSELATAVRERVFGAEELLDALREAGGEDGDDDGDGEANGEPLSPAEAFERVREVVPEWERRKHPHRWEEEWERRVERLLDWLVLVGLAERVDGGYRAV